MRNGNRTNKSLLDKRFVGFEPTYEEWKLFSSVQNSGLMVRFEPTYEEWKPGWGLMRCPLFPGVSSLPMRNGNC